MCSRSEPRPRFGVAAQTTQPIEQVRRLVALIRRRFPHSDVRFIDTVCHPTKQRQKRRRRSGAPVRRRDRHRRREQQQHARARGDLPPALFARASRPDRRLRPEWLPAPKPWASPPALRRPTIIDRVERRLRGMAPEKTAAPPCSVRSRRRSSLLFAVAMAWVEAAVVFYLRMMVDRIEPYQSNRCRWPAVSTSRVGPRGRHPGHAARRRHAGGPKLAHPAGLRAIAFGVWDIFYYVFLKVISAGRILFWIGTSSS